MARSRRFPKSAAHPRSSINTTARRPWAAVGALVASAALGGPLAARLSAAELGERSLALPQPQAVFRFDIAPGPLGAALHQFQTLTGLSVRVAADLVRNLTSTGVQGTMTADQALDVILADSQLAHRFLSPSSVLVEVSRREERVTVIDTTPALSSPKFTEPLLDTPQTITVVSRQVIESQGATNLRDILRNIPGITMQAGEGGGGLPGDSLTMRGFSASNDIFIDGVRDAGPYSRDAFNLEQVEVIKGPSSSFAGRGSTGGAINLETKSPQLRSLRNAAIGLGGADFRRTTLDFNERVAPLGDTTAARLNVMWQDAGVAGRDVVENRGWAMAPSLGVGLGTPTRLTVGFQHLQQHNVPDYGLPWGTSTDAATGEVFQTGAFNATPAVDQRNFYGLANYDFERVNNDVGTARIEHDVRPGRLTLRNITRVGDTVRDHAITAPRPPNRQLQRRWMHNAVFANQSSVSASATTGVVRHDIAGGVEIGREHTDTKNSAQTTNQPSVPLRNPDPAQQPFGPMPEITGNPSSTRTSTIGVYLFDTLDVSSRLHVSGGLRWDRSDVDYALTTLATGGVTELGRVDRMLSGRAGIVYKPTAASSIYAGYGTSFNPASDAGTVGAALSAADTAVNSVNLEPEKSRNIELGAKAAAFGNRLQVTGAVFDTEKSNARTRNLTSDPFVLAGRQRVRGVEVGASGELRPGWTALASFSLMHSGIVDSANATETGRDLALTPNRTGSVWTTWEVNRRLSVGGGAQYMDAMFRNTTTDLSVPSYWLVNAMASYELNSHLTLRVNGTNLGNRHYPDRVGGGHYVPGPTRTVQATATVGF